MKKINGNKKGFTLAELLIVIAIIAILASIAIPVYSGVLDKAREAVDFANIQAVMRVFQLGSIEYGTPTNGGMYFIGGGGCTYFTNGLVGNINESIMKRMVAAFGPNTYTGNVSGRPLATNYQMPPLTSKKYTTTPFASGVAYVFVLLNADGTTQQISGNSDGRPFTAIFRNADQVYG